MTMTAISMTGSTLTIDQRVRSYTENRKPEQIGKPPFLLRFGFFSACFLQVKIVFSVCIDEGGILVLQDTLLPRVIALVDMAVNEV